ncbi:IS3 family transposase [Metabacillus sp. Hm71]|uniref:IS3 family transposase n=1 Tax=Metabacillus sp. Hm71 TaxID=3450743 RepID=UPI003F4451DC
MKINRIDHVSINVNDLSEAKTLTQLRGVIEDYMVYYNLYRYQWGLKKMTREQYRGHLLSA